MSTATPSKYADPGKLNLIRTGIAALLFVIGVAWVAVYDIKVYDDPRSITWMYDLADWNWLIGFGLIMVALVIAANKGTPLGRGRGIVIGMLTCFLVGLVWIVLYYFTSNDPDFPLFSDLGQYNLLVGIALMATGFVYATKWE
ncbi:MAG TPA: cell division protein CrgA [Nocardioidaceae bacterium]|nr:cell division protein CrgA [Nocardioidaceae bacterium]